MSTSSTDFATIVALKPLGRCKAAGHRVEFKPESAASDARLLALAPLPACAHLLDAGLAKPASDEDAAAISGYLNTTIERFDMDVNRLEVGEDCAVHHPPFAGRSIKVAGVRVQFDSQGIGVVGNALATERLLPLGARIISADEALEMARAAAESGEQPVEDTDPVVDPGNSLPDKLPPTQENQQGSAVTTVTTSDLVELLGARVSALLSAAGINTLAEAAVQSEAALRAINGVGATTYAKLREAFESDPDLLTVHEAANGEKAGNGQSGE